MTAPAGRLGMPAVAFLLALAGCTTGAVPLLPHTDPLRALQLHDGMRARVSAIKAEARVDQRGQQGRIKGTVLMFVQRPGRVRFDVMTPFGPAAILTSDGQAFAFSDLREKRYLHGPTCAANIARLIGIPMTAEETATLLLGGTPQLQGATARMAWRDDHYRIDLRAATGERQEIELTIAAADMRAPPERQRLRLRRSEIFDARGRSVWRVRYDDYRVLRAGAHGIAMPFEVRVEQPRMGSDALVKFEDIELEATAPDEAFVQTPRPGMREEEAPCD